MFEHDRARTNACVALALTGTGVKCSITARQCDSAAVNRYAILRA
jgi:hypothetical protein